MPNFPAWLNRFTLAHRVIDAQSEPREWTFDPAKLPGSGDKAEDAVRNGEHAQRLLEDELLRWSLGAIRDRIRGGMEECPIRDIEGMQLLRMELDVLKAFEANLQSLIAEGKFAAAELAREEQRRGIEKRFGRTTI